LLMGHLAATGSFYVRKDNCRSAAVSHCGVRTPFGDASANSDASVANYHVQCCASRIERPQSGALVPRRDEGLYVDEQDAIRHMPAFDGTM